MPKERERILSEQHTEVRIVIDNELKSKLTELRSLLGTKGAVMSLAELIDYMVGATLEVIKAKKFGKKRAQMSAPIPTPASELQSGKNPRYISNAIKHRVWRRDRGRCTNCGSQRHINYDHIVPVAHGGLSTPENLRLLCFHCNQRQAIRTLAQEK